MAARAGVRIFVEPQQGASYDQLLNVARTAEATAAIIIRSSGEWPNPRMIHAAAASSGAGSNTFRCAAHSRITTAANFRIPRVYGHPARLLKTIW